jgi:hypothetical protein
MRERYRKLAGVLSYLLLLCLVVAYGSKTTDQWILILVWSAFLIGSVILLFKNARQPRCCDFQWGGLWN